MNNKESRVARAPVLSIRARFLLALFVSICAAPHAGAAVAYIQSNYATPQTPQTTVTVTFTGAQTAGNLNFVAVGWEDSTHLVQSVTDTNGNTYAIAANVLVSTRSLMLFYAKNIAAATAGSNTVTVTFNGAAAFPDIRIVEYSGLDPTNPLDGAVGATGNSINMSSGSLTITNANDLLVAANDVEHSTTTPDANFTQRLQTSNQNIVEDRLVSATGSYSASAAQGPAGDWVMQMAAFKAASTGGGDTQAPTPPSGLQATAASSSQINLIWTASTDNVGVAGYRVERCQGAGCSTFTQIATPTGTTFSDTGLTASTSYSYRVRAADAVPNLSGYSNTATATTSASGTSQGPVAQWTFDEGTGGSAADSSGNGKAASLSGTTWTTGIVGPNALNLAGGTAAGTVDGSGVLADLPAMTVSVWIKPTGAGDGAAGRIVDKTGWLLKMSSPTAVQFVRNLSAQPTARYSTDSIVLNTWQHVVATWDGGLTGAHAHVYINGVLADATLNDGSGTYTSDSTLPLTIGNRQALDRGFTGAIDDLRIYNRVLSAAEIQALAGGSGGGGDTQAPTAPAGLSATTASSSQINLSWTASTDNVGVAGYRVERCQGAGCSTFTQIATPTGITFSDTGLTASTSYSYRVRAADAVPNLSGYSSTASATTSAAGDTTKPTAPTGLIVLAASSSEIDLAWNPSTDNVGVTGYVIERCQGASCSSYGTAGTSVPTAFNDAGRSASTSYSYRVRATDAAGNLSDPSPAVTQQTPASSPDCN